MRHWFPNITALVSEWPPEKWLALPLVLYINFGLLLGIAGTALEHAGWYDEQVAARTEFWGS